MDRSRVIVPLPRRIQELPYPAASDFRLCAVYQGKCRLGCSSSEYQMDRSWHIPPANIGQRVLECSSVTLLSNRSSAGRAIEVGHRHGVIEGIVEPANTSRIGVISRST